METTTDKAKEKLREWKGELEYLRLQMNLGAKEAHDEFEEMRKTVGAWARSVSEKAGELQESGSEDLTRLKTKLDELRVQAALGRAEAGDALEQQHKDLNKKLQEVQYEAKKLYEHSNENMSAFGESVGDKVSSFETRFDLLRLQFNLAKADAKDLWEEKKKTISYKMQEMSGKVDRHVDELGDHWEGFSSEMKEAWTHIKAAFRN